MASDADAVVFGTVQKTDANTVRVQVRLFNVRSRQAVFAKEYTGSAANPRAYAHTISDELHQQQRGLRGVARTKLTFDSDPAGRKQAGKGHMVYRSVDNSSDVFVAVEFASADDAKSFRERLLSSGALDNVNVKVEPTVVEEADTAQY